MQCVLVNRMRGGRFAGRFAQARGNSSWAKEYNRQVFGSKMTGTFAQSFERKYWAGSLSSVRMLSSYCVGEIPLNGFAEQYRSVTSSFTSVGESSSNGDSVAGDSDAQVVAGATVADELEFVQIAEVPTLFTYCHDFEMIRHDKV
jgi:hypothetical protein